MSAFIRTLPVKSKSLFASASDAWRRKEEGGRIDMATVRGGGQSYSADGDAGHPDQPLGARGGSGGVSQSLACTLNGTLNS